jgi:hypothetical protein
VETYLRVRRVEQRWSLRRLLTELHVGPAWLKDQLHRLRIPRPTAALGRWAASCASAGALTGHRAAGDAVSWSEPGTDGMLMTQWGSVHNLASELTTALTGRGCWLQPHEKPQVMRRRGGPDP